MKLFLVVGVLTGLYLYMLLHTTNIVLSQTQHLNAAYQYVGNHANSIAAGHQQ